MPQTALLTGMDSSIIATGICDSLLRTGYDVIAVASTGRLMPGDDDRVRFDEDRADLPSVVFEHVDFASVDSLQALLARLATREYDVIINCATILALTPDGGLRDESTNFDCAEFGRVVQSNVTAVAALCLGLKDNLRDGASIINVTSSAAKEGAFATISYNASKAAIENLTKSLANVLGPSKGVRVNSIAPGWIPPSSDAAAEGVVAIANALTPLLAVGTPADVVAAVHYLIGSSFHNGSVLTLDGGIASSYLPYMLESLQLRGAPVDEISSALMELLAQAKREMR